MKKFLLTFIFLPFLISCGNDDDTSTTNQFRQEDFLANYATLIEANFENLMTQNTTYQNALNEFNADKTETNLTSLQNAWKQLYFSWMSSNAYNFGEAGANGIRRTLATEIGTFPVNSEEINHKINSRNFALSDAQRNTRGLNTIEYLIFSDLSTLTGNKLDYLIAISGDVNSRINTVNGSWQGTYKTTFSTNTGTNVTSSTAQFFNSWLQSISNLQSMKVGAPIGKYDDNNEKHPDFVENYYSKTSLKHLKEHFNQLKLIWEGNGDKGWDDYVASKPNGTELKTKIDTQFSTVENKLSAISSNKILSNMVVNETATLEDIFEEIRKLEVLVKTDMASLLTIAVTATDQDGD